MSYTINTTNPALSHYIEHAVPYIENCCDKLCCDIEDLELGESASVVEEITVPLPPGENMARTICLEVHISCGQDFTVKVSFS